MQKNGIKVDFGHKNSEIRHYYRFLFKVFLQL